MTLRSYRSNRRDPTPWGAARKQRPSNSRIARRRFVILSLIGFTVIVGLFRSSSEQSVGRRSLAIKDGNTLKRVLKSSLEELQFLADQVKLPEDERLSILALGGSVTWAYGLQSRVNGYPNLLGRLLKNATVDNLAIRAEGTSTPARCIETLTKEPSQGFFSSEALEMTPKPYHVILLEFTMNGADELKELIARLRQRYPSAVFVYVHLHPKPDYEALDDNHYRVMKKQMISTIQDQSQDNKPGHVYSLPFNDDTSQWYTKDGIHLNLLGHMLITSQILNSLKNETLPETPQLGEWETEDYCKSWFMSGILPDDIVVEGGTMAQWNEKGGKYAYEISDRASMSITNPFPAPVPLGLVFMAKGGAHNPYPEVVIDIEGNADSFTIQPTTDRIAHVQKTEEVGLLKPGDNLVQFEVKGSSDWPLRITGISLLFNKTAENTNVAIIGKNDKTAYGDSLEELDFDDSILKLEGDVNGLLENVNADALQSYLSVLGASNKFDSESRDEKSIPDVSDHKHHDPYDSHDSSSGNSFINFLEKEAGNIPGVHYNEKKSGSFLSFLTEEVNTVRGAFSHDQDEEGETTNQESPKAKSTEGPRTSTGTTTTLEETEETPKSQKPPKETAPQMETILREERKPEKISERETREEAGGELEPKSFDEEQKVPVDRDTVREKIKKDEAEEEAKREREIQEEPAETISKSKDDAIVKERATSDSLAEFGQAKYQESDSSGGSESTLLGDDVKPAKNSLPSRVREDVPDPDPKKDAATYTLVEGNEVTKPIRPKPKFAAKAYETPLPVPKMNTPRPPPESTAEGQFGKIDAEYDGTNSAGAAGEILPTKDEKPKDIKSVPLHVEENSDASTKKIVSELKEAVAAVEKVIEEESEKIVHGASQAITDIEEYVEAGGTSRKEEESRSNSILNDSALSRQQIAEPSAPASSSTTAATTMTASTTEEDKTNEIQQVDLNRRASLFRKNEPSPPSNDPDVASFITTKSGLQFQIIKDGSGPKPYPGASVDTSYVGYLNGFGNERLQFDAAKHFSFQVGNGEVIAGWDEAFLDMREGEQRRLIIPSSLAYGSAGAGGIIPPDATLYFQVELLSMSTKGVKQNKK